MAVSTPMEELSPTVTDSATSLQGLKVLVLRVQLLFLFMIRLTTFLALCISLWLQIHMPILPNHKQLHITFNPD